MSRPVKRHYNKFTRNLSREPPWKAAKGDERERERERWFNNKEKKSGRKIERRKRRKGTSEHAHKDFNSHPAAPRDVSGKEER